MEYLVIKHDYTKKCTVVDETFESIHNASEYLQDKVFGYIIEKIGSNFSIHEYHRFRKPASRYWNQQNYGYHVVKDALTESIYKMYVVYKKKIRGLFYDDYVIIPLFYYEIARQNYDVVSDDEDIYGFYQETTKEQMETVQGNYQLVMDELNDYLNKRNKKNEIPIDEP